MTYEIWKHVVESGDLKAVIDLDLKKTSGITDRIVDYACCQGHFDIVKYLLENRNEGCTTWAMDWAALYNRLDILEYLHNKKKYCTFRAMNFAATNGNLEIVTWLHVNRIEGCTKDAMNEAFFGGHIDVIKFLHENRTEEFDNKDALQDAIKNKHFDVVEWYKDNLETSIWKKFEIKLVLTSFGTRDWFNNFL
jgi:hypothetical protein